MLTGSPRLGGYRFGYIRKEAIEISSFEKSIAVNWVLMTPYLACFRPVTKCPLRHTEDLGSFRHLHVFTELRLHLCCLIGYPELNGSKSNKVYKR